MRGPTTPFIYLSVTPAVNGFVGTDEHKKKTSSSITNTSSMNLSHVSFDLHPQMTIKIRIANRVDDNDYRELMGD